MISCDLKTKHPVNVLSWQFGAVYHAMVTWGNVVVTSVAASTRMEALRLAHDGIESWLKEGRKKLQHADDDIQVALQQLREEVEK